jgi:cyclophilin family peptidyl-prolyl cis-trans isomerase
MAAEGDPRVLLQTSLGDITLELDRAHAPVSSDNFLHYVTEGRFDGIRFYRVVPQFVIQTGLFGGGNNAAPRDPIPLEANNGLSNSRGSVAFAHGDDPNSGGSDFFIDVADNTALDPQPDDRENKTGYAVFAHVVDGMDVVDRIAAVPLGGDGPFAGSVPLTPVIVTKAVVIQP